jgi:hypothetical protein
VEEEKKTTETKTDFFGIPEKDAAGKDKTETTTTSGPNEGDKEVTETKTGFFGIPEKDAAGKDKTETTHTETGSGN